MLHPDYQYNFFLRKSKASDPSRIPIYLRIVHLGHRKDISTKLVTEEGSWLGNAYRVKNNGPAEAIINSRLNDIESSLKNAMRYLCQTRDYFSLEDWWAFCEGERATTGLVAYFIEIVKKNEARIGTTLSPNTQKVYNSTLKHLKTFLQKEIKRNEISLKATNTGLIENFLQYLLTKCNRNTSNKYLKTLRAVLNSAVKDELIYKNPFDHVRLRSCSYNRTYLDSKELELLMTTNIENHSLYLAKELLLVSCFTGMHYSDIVDLEASNIVTKDGAEFIVKRRQKTEEPFIVPLFPQVKKIIERHAQYQSDAKLFKFYSNQYTNKYLKEVAALCGIKKNITCKVGRHTFGTTVTLQNNVPIESVSKMMGHTKITTTQIYARVLEVKLVKDTEGILKMYA